MTNVQKGKQMGRDDPVTRVGNEISEAEMGNKMEGMGWGGIRNCCGLEVKALATSSFPAHF